MNANTIMMVTFVVAAGAAIYVIYMELQRQKQMTQALSQHVRKLESMVWTYNIQPRRREYSEMTDDEEYESSDDDEDDEEDVNDNNNDDDAVSESRKKQTTRETTNARATTRASIRLQQSHNTTNMMVPPAHSPPQRMHPLEAALFGHHPLTSNGQARRGHRHHHPGHNHGFRHVIHNEPLIEQILRPPGEDHDLPAHFMGHAAMFTVHHGPHNVQHQEEEQIQSRIRIEEISNDDEEDLTNEDDEQDSNTLTNKGDTNKGDTNNEDDEQQEQEQPLVESEDDLVESEDDLVESKESEDDVGLPDVVSFDASHRGVSASAAMTNVSQQEYQATADIFCPDEIINDDSEDEQDNEEGVHKNDDQNNESEQVMMESDGSSDNDVDVNEAGDKNKDWAWENSGVIDENNVKKGALHSGIRVYVDNATNRRLGRVGQPY